jgi:uncharacterized protein YneR
MNEAEEKAKVIKEALKIVNSLGKYYFEDKDELIQYEDELKELTFSAKKLKKNKYWKL